MHFKSLFRISAIIVLLLSMSKDVFSQCSCTNCPFTTISNGTVTSTINISGSTNNTLGSNGQSLAAICLDFVSDAIDEIDVTIFAPNGSSVLLIQNTGISVGQNIGFDICFTQCVCAAEPDSGFDPYFDSSESWNNNGNYTGIYYPSNATPGGGTGCLEELTGSVNGNWVLEITDFVGLDNNDFNNWELIFEDNSGLNCTANTFCTPPCEAEAGELTEPNVSFCEGSSDLSFSINPVFNNDPEPDQQFYGDTVVVYDLTTGIIIAYQESPDLTSFSPGQYQVCHLSYLINEVSMLVPPNGSYTYSNLSTLVNSDSFCADLSNSCITVEITAVSNPILDGPLNVCAGELVNYLVVSPNSSSTYTFTITQGNFSQFINNFSSVQVEFISGPATLCVTETNACGSFTTCIDITVNQANSPVVIDGPLLICPGESTTYSITPSINSNEFFDITITQGIISSTTNDEITILWDANASGTAELCVGINGGQCDVPPTCIDIDIVEYIEPAINTFPIICIGENGIASVTPDPSFTDYAWTLVNLDEISGNGSPTIEFTANIGGPATICLSVENSCGFQTPVCEDINVIELIEPQIINVPPSCEFDFNLSANINPIYNITWSQIAGPSSAIIQNSGLPSTFVSVSSPGTYQFMLEYNDGVCFGDPKFIEVIVFEEPELIFLDHNCGLNQEYTVTIQIGSGSLPYFINGVQLNDNVYISDPIPSEEFYSFLVVDNNGCSTLIEGTFLCNCEAEAGSMSTNLLYGCSEAGSVVEAEYFGDAVLDSDDFGYYVLHTNPFGGLGDIVSYNENGIFEYTNEIIPGDTYFISYVVGNYINSEPDFDDPCIMVSIGQPVIFFPPPASINNLLPDPATSCEECITIQLNELYDSIEFTNLLGNCDINYDSNANSISICAVESGQKIIEYTIVQFGCAATYSMILDFSIDFSLEILQEECADNLLTYQASVLIFDQYAPYNSNLNGTFTDSSFLTDPLPLDSIIEIEITNSIGCVQTITSGPVLCNCDNDSGTVNAENIVLCPTDSLSLKNLSNEDYILSQGIDTIAFAIYNSPTAQKDDYIYLTFDEQSYSVNQGFNFNQWYYVKVLTGPFIYNPDLSLDFDSPCIIESEPIPFIWYPEIQFDFDISESLCTDNDSFTWEQVFELPYPYSFELSNLDGLSLEFNVNDTLQNITLPVSEGSQEWTISSYNGTCQYNASGTIIVEGIAPEIPEIIGPDSICNNAFFGSVIILDELLSDISLNGTWYLNNAELTEPTIDFDGYTEGNYELTFSTIGYEDPCPGSETNFDIYVKSCVCPQVQVVDEILICDTEEIYSLEDAISSTLSGQYQILNPNGLENPPSIINATSIDITNSSEGTYIIQFTLDGDWPAECTLDFYSNIEIEINKTSGQQVEIPEFCQSDLEINLFDYLQDYDSGGIWSHDDTTINSILNINEYPLGENFFTYRFDSTTVCSSVETEITIIINEQPFYQSFDTTLCNTSETIDPSTLIFSTSSGEFSILNPENNPNPPFINNGMINTLGASPGIYTVVFENTEVQSMNCTLFAEAQLIIENQLTAGDSADLLKYCINDDVLVNLNELIIDEDIGGSWTYNGMDIDETISTTNLELGDNIFTYTVLAEQACEDVFTDVIIEIIPSPEVTGMTEDVLCFGDENGIIEIQLLSNEFGPFSYTLNNTNESFDQVIDNLPPGTYSVTIFNNENCFTTLENLIIEEPQIINVDLGEDKEANFKDIITVEALINLVESDINEISWEDLSGALDDKDLDLTQEVIQNNSITITITDENGCIATDQIFIRLLENDISLSNIIVPSSSYEENRFFGMPALKVVNEVQQFMIFDRWGNKVFEASNYIPGDPNGFWDGTFQSSLVKQGVYSYYMQYELVTGELRELIGDVTVIR